MRKILSLLTALTVTATTAATVIACSGDVGPSIPMFIYPEDVKHNPSGNGALKVQTLDSGDDQHEFNFLNPVVISNGLQEIVLNTLYGVNLKEQSSGGGHNEGVWTDEQKKLH